MLEATMSATKTRTSSLSRNFSALSSSQTPGLKHGPNGTTFISSGIPDLDSNLLLLTLLRNYRLRWAGVGLVLNQPLLYASPSKDPRGFLGTLPCPVSSKDDMSHNRDPDQEKGLRIAWQYKKYFGENQQNFEIHKDGKCEFCNDFDLRKPLERQFLTGKHIDCVSIQDSPNLDPLRDHCAKFLSQFPRNDGGVTCAGRIAIQSLCAPQCEYSNVIGIQYNNNRWYCRSGTFFPLLDLSKAWYPQ
ncbi:hypothetical protein FEM48_Zijuj08G0142400 [Ziziphus jujuba var. spinosa]|uniref:Elongator complex protein 4 n=1 Tax=Ziziphus jujuba var. spinosa TaxID=714518 RepID=A0A978UZK9_ZIZJJ|nr:hypothetical protein FEM48_Zijuj08G0142400 [Ziziphus jujuba var. spinosa]